MDQFDLKRMQLKKKMLFFHLTMMVLQKMKAMMMTYAAGVIHDVQVNDDDKASLIRTASFSRALDQTTYFPWHCFDVDDAYVDLFDLVIAIKLHQSKVHPTSWVCHRSSCRRLHHYTTMVYH